MLVDFYRRMMNRCIKRRWMDYDERRTNRIGIKDYHLPQDVIFSLLMARMKQLDGERTFRLDEDLMYNDVWEY